MITKLYPNKNLKIFVFLLIIHCKNPGILDLINELDTIEWNLVWHDEFNGEGEVDLAKWDKPEYNRRNNNKGKDGWWLKENSYQDGNGNLVIKASKIDNRNSDNDAHDYATGAVRSKNKFEQKYGKFEVRCRLPTQPGWWVAFWLMSESVGNVDSSGEDGTEIDIMEGFGWTDRINQALHWDGYGDDHKSVSHSLVIEGIRNEYHHFSLEWNEKEYVFFVDGIEIWRTNAGGVSKVPAYIKLTGELSTESWAIGDWWSKDPSIGKFPDYFLIDYVRVWIKIQDRSQNRSSQQRKAKCSAFK